MHPSLTDKLADYAELMRLDRPIGIWLLLWPTLWGLWFAADGLPDRLVFIVFVLGTVLMRSAGCVINDWADRDIDPYVARTAQRPLATGRVRSWEALLLFALLALTAFALVLLLNPLTLWMSFGAILLAATYPFHKRLTAMPQAHLGVAFGWAIPMAFAAQTESLPLLAWVLLIITVLWAVAYDTMYAMVDRDDDLRIGVKSSAILFGDRDRWVIAGLQIAVLVALALVGWWQGLGPYYFAGLGLAAVCAMYQQWLLRQRFGPDCLRAFLNNHLFGAAVFGGLLLDKWPV